MAKDKEKTKQKEPKMILEREYIVPLRREWLKVGTHKRANRAIKELKIFMARHMKIYDRDLRKIKIDQVLNNEIRFRGMRKPPAKIRVLAKKFDNETVRVELIDIPEHVKFARLREEKTKKEVEKKGKASSEAKASEGQAKEEKKPEEVKQEDKEVKAEEKEKAEEAKEKEQASKDETLKIAKEQAREQKHISKPQNSVEKNFASRKSLKGR